MAFKWLNRKIRRQIINKIKDSYFKHIQRVQKKKIIVPFFSSIFKVGRKNKVECQDTRK